MSSLSPPLYGSLTTTRVPQLSLIRRAKNRTRTRTNLDTRDGHWFSAGHTYDRRAIASWLQYIGREPLGGLPCREADLRANASLRAVIVWMREQGIIADDDDDGAEGGASERKRR